MNIVRLETEERWAHHRCYRENDLFRHWERVLNPCEQQTGIDAISLWNHSLKVLKMLKDTTSHREEMIGFLMNEMERVNPILHVEAVMAIVLTQLANAQEKGHTHEPHANDAMCVSILFRYDNEQGFFRWLINRHRQLKLGYDGKEVILTPYDPMTDEVSIKVLAKTRQDEIQRKLHNVLEKTAGVQSLFGSEYDNWKQLWSEILKEDELFMLIDEVNPRGNKWGMNLKMVANVMGMFNTCREIEVAASKLNSCLDGSDRNSYISRWHDTSRTHCALNEVQRNRIKGLIKAL